MVKKIVRCGKCENRIIDNGVGFTKISKLKCGHFHMDVDKDDGCTFGKEGDQIYSLCRHQDVDLGSHSVVYGYH